MKKLDRKTTVIKSEHAHQELDESGERLVTHEGKFMSLAEVLKLEADKQVAVVEHK